MPGLEAIVIACPICDVSVDCPVVLTGKSRTVGDTIEVELTADTEALNAHLARHADVAT